MIGHLVDNKKNDNNLKKKEKLFIYRNLSLT